MESFYWHFSKSRYFKNFIKFSAICPLGTNSTPFKCWAVFMMLARILIFIFQMYGRGFHVTVRKNYKVIVIGTLNTIIEVVCNVVMTLRALYINDDFKKNVLDDINRMDAILAKYTKSKSKTICSYFHLLLLNTVFHLSLVLNNASRIFTNQEFGLQFLYYGVDIIWGYRISNLVFYIYYLLRGFHERILAINNMLITLFGKRPVLSENVINYRNVIRDVSELHAKFTQTIGYFNELFGWQLLLIFLGNITLFIISYETGLRVTSLPFNYDLQISIWLSCSMIYAMVWYKHLKRYFVIKLFYFADLFYTDYIH